MKIIVLLFAGVIEEFQSCFNWMPKVSIPANYFVIVFLVSTFPLMGLLCFTINNNRHLRWQLNCIEAQRRSDKEFRTESIGELRCQLRDAHLTLLKLGRNHVMTDDFAIMSAQKNFPLVAQHCIQCHPNSWPEEDRYRKGE